MKRSFPLRITFSTTRTSLWKNGRFQCHSAMEKNREKSPARFRKTNPDFPSYQPLKSPFFASEKPPLSPTHRQCIKNRLQKALSGGTLKTSSEPSSATSSPTVSDVFNYESLSMENLHDRKRYGNFLFHIRAPKNLQSFQLLFLSSSDERIGVDKVDWKLRPVLR